MSKVVPKLGPRQVRALQMKELGKLPEPTPENDYLRKHGPVHLADRVYNGDFDPSRESGDPKELDFH